MKKLNKKKENKIKETFKWRTRNNQFLSIKEMETRHLFYTLRMIWNHSAPENLKFHPYRKYRFSSFYTSHYMKRAVKAMLEEIATRKDILLQWEYELNCMVYWANVFNLGKRTKNVSRS